MPWVLKGRKLYYYTTRRVGRRVWREYHGSGPEARLAAALDDARRSERLARRRAAHADRARWAGVEALLVSHWDLVELLARAALLAAGCWQHDGGEWRRKRRGPDVLCGGAAPVAGASAVG